MINQCEIEWKFSGVLPAPIHSGCKYYKKHLDQNYCKRTFGDSKFVFSTESLEPTNLFHQALRAELSRTHGLEILAKKFPYQLNFEGVGSFNTYYKFRIFGEKVLVISMLVKFDKVNLLTEDAIQLLKISSHGVVMDIIRFCFNVHYSPNPMRVEVNSLTNKPLMRIFDIENSLDSKTLVELVTRHIDIDDRATSEMIDKNASLNFNKDSLLLDKQGVVFYQCSTDYQGQKNRYQRIATLLEFALHWKCVESIVRQKEITDHQKVIDNIDSVNKVLRSKVLNESVSASRSWDLLQKELHIKELNLDNRQNKNGDVGSFGLKRILKFPKSPIFVAISKVAGLLAAVIAVVAYFRGT